MKTKYSHALFLVLILTKFLSGTELKLELVDVQSLALENEKTAQPTVFTGVPFQIKATVINGDRNTGNVSIEGIDSDKMHVQGRSHHTNIVMNNNAYQSTIEYLFQIQASQEGTFTLGPAHVKQNNDSIHSNTVQIRVINQPEDTSKIKTASGEKLENLSRGNEVTCELIADKKNVFQGEPFVVTLKISINSEITNIGLDQINFQGFTSKELGQAQKRQEQKDTNIIEIVEKKFALIPIQTGTLTISPAKIIYQVPIRKKHRPRGFFGDDFFSGFFDQVELQQKQVLSNKLNIDVKQLPQTNSLCDGIGVFKNFTLSTDKTTALANEAIALTLEIEGFGNFDQISTPKLQVPNFIKNYESKTDFEANPALGNFGGKKKFEYVIQISNLGQITIPAQKFTYFDPESKSYKTIQTNEITMQINQPLNETQEQSIQQIQPSQQNQPESKVISKDISFIEEDAKMEHRGTWKIPLWLFFVLILFPIIFLFNFHNKLIVFATKSKVFKIFSKKATLSKFENEFEALKKNNETEKLYLFFLKLLAEKFDTDMQLITTDFITEKLTATHWDLTKINDFVDFFNECASLHFITTKQTTAPDLASILFKKGQYWIMILTNQN